MASITSATSGPSSSTSTWTGGVVPGTTFAGTRTTTAAGFAIGATTIALQAGSPAVTAGKWIKFAGHSAYHRVTTGLGTGAGNIVLTQGLEEAIPASATVVSVDMVDDKVTIAHPGTNNVSLAAYQLNGAHSAGAATINVNAGSGTILAGECIQLEHQIGTEDGQPVYDNTYYKVATSLAAGVIVIEPPGLAYAMASGVRVVNRGHVVELVANHVWGDDTSSTTAANNGIVVLGTIKASRSVSQTLTCRGTMINGASGRVDIGAAGDLLPGGIVATVRLNDSPTLSTGKHGLVSHTSNTLQSWSIRGTVKRRRNTQTSSAISAGGTSMTVENSDGWQIGDRVILASDNADPARFQIVTLTGGSPPTWTCGAITIARPAGTWVGNLTSNVVVKALNEAFQAPVGFATLSSGRFYSLDVSDVRFENCGPAGGWVGASNNIPGYYGIGLMPGDTPWATEIKRCAHEITWSGSSNALFTTDSLSAYTPRFVDCSGYGASTSNGFYAGQNSTGQFIDSVVYRANNGASSAFSAGGVPGVVSGGALYGTANALSANAGKLICNQVDLLSLGPLFFPIAGEAVLNNCTINVARLISGQNNATGTLTVNSPTVVGASLTGDNTTGNRPAQSLTVPVTAVNGGVADNRNINYHRVCTTDLTTRKRSTYAVKIQPKVASTPITYTFTTPAVSGVAQVIKGSLRFDTTYGTATPPSIALAGQGVSQSFTASATADAWHDFSFSFTPTSTGDITATVTVQSASTSGFAWLDGVYHYPMTQSVRHFGYLWQPQANQVADPLITVSEATALAYPVTVDHGTNTITVTGNATTADVWHACMADLVQTANQGEPQHITGGPTFTTSYDVVVNTGVTLTGAFTTSGTVTLTGTGDVAGVYTDSTGRHVKIIAANLLSGSRVQLYNVTDSTELLNTELTGAGLSHALTHSADKTVRLRVAKLGYLPVQATGVLTASGLSFLDAQVVDAVYVANGVDGSAVTGLTPDYPNLQIDANIAGGSIGVQDIYAWTRYANWVAADGIRLMHNSVQASDTANYTIDVSVVDAKFDNNSATPLQIIGGYIRRSDGTTVIGEGSIQLDPGKAYVASSIATQVNEIALLHGLVLASPLEVTETTRTAGTITQTIATASGTTTVTRT